MAQVSSAVSTATIVRTSRLLVDLAGLGSQHTSSATLMRLAVLWCSYCLSAGIFDT